MSHMGHLLHHTEHEIPGVQMRPNAGKFGLSRRPLKVSLELTRVQVALMITGVSQYVRRTRQQPCIHLGRPGDKC